MSFQYFYVWVTFFTLILKWTHSFESFKESGEKQSIHYISCDKPPQNLNSDQDQTIVPGDNYSYVQLTAVSYISLKMVFNKKQNMYTLFF